MGLKGKAFILFFGIIFISLYALNASAYVSLNYSYPSYRANNSNYTNLIINFSVVTNDSINYAFLDINNSIYAWWSFDNFTNNGTPDLSDNDRWLNFSSVSISESNQTGGIFNKAISFRKNVTNQMRSWKATNFSILPEYTLSVWFYFYNTTQTSSGVYHGLLGNMKSNSRNGTALSIVNSSNYYILRYTLSNSSASVASFQNSSFYLWPDRWYNAVITRKNDDYFMYVNGYRIAELNSNNGGTVYDTPLDIGSFAFDSLRARLLNGSIDDILILNRSLNADEVLSLYNASDSVNNKIFNNLSVNSYSIKVNVMSGSGLKNVSSERIYKIFAQLNSCHNDGTDFLNLSNCLDNIFVNQKHLNCTRTANRNLALNPQTPFCNLSTALVAINENDKVFVMNGTYNDNAIMSYKTINKDVLITTYPNQYANLTNIYEEYLHTPNVLWTNVSTSNYNLWMTDVSTWDSLFVHYTNGTELFIYQTYANMLNNSRPEGSWANDTPNKVIIRLDDGKNPNNIPFYVEHYEMYVLGFENVTGGGKIRVENFTIMHSKWGIYIKNSTNIQFKNLNINFTTTGLKAKGVNNQNISIISSKIYNVRQPKRTWNEYALGETTYMNNAGIDYYTDCKGNNTIKDNVITGSFDGIRLLTGSEGFLVQNNTILNLLDDGFEIEGYNSNIMVYNNTVDQALSGLALAYSNCSSACYAKNNIFLIDKPTKLSNSSDTRGYCYKVGESSGHLVNWSVDHNTCYSGNIVLVAIGSNDYCYNTTWTNNIFIGNNSQYLLAATGLAKNGCYWNNNLFYSLIGSFVIQNYNNLSSTAKWLTIENATTSINAPIDWDNNSRTVNPLFFNISNRDFRLANNSLACRMSTTASFVGALACVSSNFELLLSNLGNFSTDNVSTIISWNTNELANSSVCWGTSISYGNCLYNSTRATALSFWLGSLENSTLYFYNVTSCDDSLSSGSCASSNRTFVTGERFSGKYEVSEAIFVDVFTNFYSMMGILIVVLIMVIIMAIFGLKSGIEPSKVLLGAVITIVLSFIVMGLGVFIQSVLNSVG